MAASLLASPFKFSAINRDVYVLPSCANISSPTRAELNAGTNIRLHLDKDAGLAGFELTHNTITMTSMGDGIGYAVSDGNAYGSPSITAHQSKGGPTGDVRSVFVEGSTQYVVIFDTTDTAGLKMDVFAVTVNPITKSRTGGSMLMVPFDIGSSARDVTVPA
jgi:hypothetical protein